MMGTLMRALGLPNGGNRGQLLGHLEKGRVRQKIERALEGNSLELPLRTAKNKLVHHF